MSGNTEAPARYVCMYECPACGWLYHGKTSYPFSVHIPWTWMCTRCRNAWRGAGYACTTGYMWWYTP